MMNQVEGFRILDGGKRVGCRLAWFEYRWRSNFSQLTLAKNSKTCVKRVAPIGGGGILDGDDVEYCCGC